jgi:dihydrofolate reductase
MRKLVVKEWMTLDGVIDAETMDQWFVPYDSSERRSHIKEVYEQGDAYLLGRATYDLLAPGWSGLPDEAVDGIAGVLRRMQKYVVSSTLKSADWKNSTIIGGDVVNTIARLKQEPGRDIVLDGSATLAHSLMEAGLIDEYRFLVQPHIMGTGLRFFAEGTPPTRLKLVNAQSLSLGVLALTYQPDRD